MESESIDELKKIFTGYSSKNLDKPSDVLIAIRDKLFTILCSPMKDDFAHEAYKWVTQLTMMFGDFSWISPYGRWEAEDEIKIFLCVTRLSLTEVELLVPLVERHFLFGDEPEIEDGKMIMRSANTVDYDKFGNHLVIIENLIKALVKDDKNDDDDCNRSDTNHLTSNMKSSDLTNLLDHLKRIITMILCTLERGFSRWNDIEKSYDNEQYAAFMGCVRLSAIWMANDPDGFVEQTNKFLIDLYVTSILVEADQNIDILVVALHSLCTVESTLESIRKQSRLREAMEKYLDHVTSEYNQPANSSQQLRRQTKIYKLRCGMVKDILEALIEKQ